MTKKEILNIKNIELPDDEGKRQAIASIKGYMYQIHQAASVWIDLKDNEELYLEISEDQAKYIKDIVTQQEILTATQIKDTVGSGSITLNSTEVKNCIQKLFDYKQKNPDKNIRFCFLTTSTIGEEKKNKLPQNPMGIYAWNNVNDKNIQELRDFLLKSSFSDDFNDFIKTSSEDNLKDFIKCMTFIYDAPNIMAIETTNKKKLQDKRNIVDSTIENAEKAYDNIFYEIIKTIINSDDRKLTKNDFINCFRKATSVYLPSQVVENILKEKDSNNFHQIDNKKLREIAERSLNNSLPTDLSLMFSSISSNIQNAHKKLMEYERYLLEYNSNNEETNERCISYKILKKENKKNIYYADPGSGKTYTLWKIAKKLLEQGDIIPIFVPLGNLNTWDEVLNILSSLSPGVNPIDLINQPNICLCLDGWSEFAMGQYFSERNKALIAMNNVYIIANARHADVSDNVFHRWTLENIELSNVIEVLKMCNLDASSKFLNFLQNPLSLLLYIFLNGGTSVGELLQKFHNHLTNNIVPENFQYILCEAISSMIFNDEHSYLIFEAELKKYAQSKNISEPIRLLNKLGTIKERNGKILPIHDLYWSWLGGKGIFQNNKLKDCVINLKTHESINLALESGERTTVDVIKAIIPIDIFLAAKLDKQYLFVNIDKQLNKMLNDRRLAIRYRAAISVISCGIDKYITKALDIISEIYENKIYIKELKIIFQPSVLLKYTKELKVWVGKKGTNLLLDSIIESGKSEWLTWLEDIINKEGINKSHIIAAAIACSGSIPQWCDSYLNDFIKEESYQLKVMKYRGINKNLTKWILENYNDITISNDSRWCHINQYLVNCAEDEDFEKIITNYNNLSEKAQELIEYAIVDRGEPWIGKLQKIVLSKPLSKNHHRIRDVLSLEINDDTARQWIKKGYVKEGWRVLVSRHQNAIIPELVEKLPKTFSNQHYIPTLNAMEYLKKTDNGLIDKIYSRFASPMQPMATQDAIIAIGKAPAGMGFLAKLIALNPSWLPDFYIHQIVRMYTEWSKENGLNIMLKIQNGNEYSFIDYLVYITYHYHKNCHFFADILSYNPKFVIELILSEYKQNDKKSKELLSKLKPIPEFNIDLFYRMITSEILVPIIPNVFSDVLNDFPVECFQQLINSKYVELENILYKLSNANSVKYKKVHIQIIRHVLQSKININNYHQISNMLRLYSRDEIFDILKSVYNYKSSKNIFFVRELENVRQERLIDENGRLLKNKKDFLQILKNILQLNID